MSARGVENTVQEFEAAGTRAGRGTKPYPAHWKNGTGLNLLVLQASPFCNIDCSYCYLPARTEKRRMSDEVLAAAFRRVVESGTVNGPFVVVWHAGEPFALPVAWYENAFRIIEEVVPPGIEYRHSFQTNATLVTPAWCRFLKDRNLDIGVSVDGPAFLHNASRKTRAGTGTFAQTMSGIDQLQDAGVNFHVITVLTRETLEFPDELYDFYMENGICQAAFNIDEMEGANRTSSLDFEDAEEAFRRFIARFWVRVRDDDFRLALREFTDAREMILNAPDTDVVNHLTAPFNITTVSVDGGISTFSPELIGMPSKTYGDFVFGNVLTDSLDAVRRSAKFRQMLDDVIDGVAACRQECEYFAVCGGGAPSNKYFENGTFRSTETQYCRLTKKAVIDLVLAEIETALDE